MRRAVLKLTDEFLTNFLSNTVQKDVFKFKVKNGLPPDVKVVRAGHSDQGVIYLVLESADFKDTKAGASYPCLEPPEFTSIYKEKL